MPKTYAIVDVETTGFDAYEHAITEIAVVILQGHDILEEYSTLINPRQHISTEITQITGITNEMVAGKPTIGTVRNQIQELLGSHVVIGHNVDFDLKFLNAERLAIGHHKLDTITLASILYPEAGRFSLESLAFFLNLPDSDSPQAHRALDDALQTAELFLALWERALTLEAAQLEEIISAGRGIGWPETLFFEEALAEQSKRAFTEGKSPAPRRKKLFKPSRVEGKSLNPVEKPKQLDSEIISSLIKPGGNFAKQFDGFEYRPQQAEMMDAVIGTFNMGEHLLIEAGTGTGKSVAYLLPAAFWAAENGRRVVVSTNTINLQDQLINKDIPELRRALPFKLQAAVRKGRSNYLCTRRFAKVRHEGPNNADEMTLFARMLLWLPTSDSGDVAEIPLRTWGEREAWSRLNSQSSSCTTDMCANERCPLHIAKRRSENAHVLIVNHALLMANAANNNHVLPEFTDLIIDEAHHLESAVTGGLSFQVDKRGLDKMLDEITRDKTGLLGMVERALAASAPQDVSVAATSIINRLRQSAQLVDREADDFFLALSFFLQDFAENRSSFAQQTRLTTAVRTQPGYDEIALAWENLHQPLIAIVGGYNDILKLTDKAIADHDVADGDELGQGLKDNALGWETAVSNIDRIIAKPSDDDITWAEVYRDKVSLHSAPLHIGPLVEEHIFQANETVVLTSATMRTASPTSTVANFDYIRNRLNAAHTHTLSVGSPFNYKKNTLLYLVSDMPEPNQPGYARFLHGAITEVATTLGGRTMVLFTSYAQIKMAETAVTPKLKAAGITVLAQQSGSSRQQLLDQFKRAGSHSVLMGTRSFWEGVDVPGEALQAVLIARLYFDVPTDPIVAARSETFDSPFFEYSVPEAALRFRQGFGRLIRRNTDEGMVVVLDKRVISKRYGQKFLDTLPDCTVIRQRHGRLAELTARWFNRDRS